MRKQRLLPIVTFILFALSSFRAKRSTNVDQFLKSILSGEARRDTKAEGDLNGDGLADWTGLIHREKAGAAPTYQLCDVASTSRRLSRRGLNKSLDRIYKI